MVEQLTRQLVAEKALVHTELPALAPQRAPTRVDRSFELPTVLYGMTVACFLGFLATLGTAFANPEMILPMAIFCLFVIAGFGVPSLWVKMKPDNPQRATSWQRFRRDGIQTLNGHTTAGAATVQVLILPVLILLWGFAVVTIAALV